jgi:hypothetical protein
MRCLVVGLVVIVAGCDRPASPTANSSPTTTVSSVAPSQTVAPTAARTNATTSVPTQAPTAAPTAAPTTPGPVFTISGTVVYADNGQTVTRTTTSAYAVTTPTFCATWNAAATGSGSYPIARIGTGAPPAYTIATVPAGTYVVVTSPLDAPGGKWFWRFGSAPTQSCDLGTRINLRADTTADFKIPR